MEKSNLCFTCVNLRLNFFPKLLQLVRAEVSEDFAGQVSFPSKCLAGDPNLCEIETVMNNAGESPPKQNYKWPWFVGAALALGIVLAIVWMSFAVRNVERERNLNAPLPNSAPVR